ncbi:unnamed protein product [Trichogramma brassicae]|uniref:Uncharacterized protein n=1 Tax=Trichogramma brassicae TaxID=86971 RepID=A0A6H5IH01_9HYME|nr:unnamed protein product [Trichogramma brassicae]
MADSYDWEFLVLKQEVRFSDEGGVSPPCLEVYQVVEPWEKPCEETYKVKKETPEDAYEDPNAGQKEQALPFLAPIKIFRPPKRGERPHIQWLNPQLLNQPLFKEAARGELSGYTKPVRGKKYATTTLYYARNKGIRGVCCCVEVLNEGEDVVKYEPHLTGLPWALHEYTVQCGGCRNNIWEITCPARCAICGPTLVLRQRDINAGRVYDTNRGRKTHRIIATIPTPSASSARLRISPCDQSTPST